MSIQSVLADLKRQRDQIDRAISALSEVGTEAPRRGRPAGSTNAASSGSTGKRRHMSAAARKRISEMMKLRWAERRKKAGKKAA